MARMVPVGMDFWASRRSPERLEPAMMPEEREDGATVGRPTALAGEMAHVGHHTNPGCGKALAQQ